MKQTRNRTLSILLAALMTLSLLTACGNQPTPATSSEPATSEAVESATSTEPVTLNVAAFKGPTGMGMAKLMADDEAGDTQPNDYEFSVLGSPSEVPALLTKGEADLVCVPANLAAVLNGKMPGNLQVLAINTLGVLYVVENGDTVQSIADLKGKTICAAGKGATPEYALRYALQQNGIDPDTDVTINWMSEHTECITSLLSGQETLALLPQPFVTTALMKSEDCRIAVDLNDVWETAESDATLITGVVMGRTEFIDAHPEAVDKFLTQYADSVSYVNDNPTEAATLIEQYGIVPAAVAEKAIPDCHIVCITGAEMAEALNGYYEVLFNQDEASVGGAIPDETFYYGA